MSRAVRLHSCQTVTPETADQHPLLLPAVAPRSTRATTRSPRRSTSALLVAFEEDRAMITAQSQARSRADPEAPMLPLAMDAAVVRFRKLVADTIAAERGGSRGADGDASAGAWTSATRARSPDWRAFRSRPSARAASATGPRRRSACSRTARRSPDGRRGSLRARARAAAWRGAAWQPLHQRPVLIGADADAARFHLLEQAGQGDHRFEAGLEGFEVRAKPWQRSERPCTRAGRYPSTEAARPGFNPALANLRRAP